MILEAQKLPADEREAFVRRRCEDTALCDQILDTIAGFKTDDGLLNRLPTDDEIAAMDDLDDDVEDLAPGTRVGPYIILDLIGRGGMGEVYLGSDPRLRRKVALKCLSASRADADTRHAQIIREARAAARIAHANVAMIHDVIEDPDRAFIVMEYVAGESLSARIKRDRLPLEKVVSIGLQLASALVAAHAKGVVHRDLKPGNVQFADGSVKVLDFGIANAARTMTPAPSSASTTKGESAPRPLPKRLVNAGTPQYMSPEQLLGRAVDERSDLYSLGLILFEMATGRRMHPTADVVEIAAAQARGAPRADTFDRKVPRGLADVIAKSLETDVARRYQTAAEVESALKVVDHELKPASADRRELILDWSARIVGGSMMAVLICLVLGLVSSRVYNYTLSRQGFDSEPLSVALMWGRMSLVGPAVLVVLTSAAAWVVAAAVRLATLWPPVRRTVSRAKGWSILVAAKSLIHDPVHLSRLTAAAGAISIVGICIRYRRVVEAWFTFAESAPQPVLAVLSDKGPQNDFRYYMGLVVVVMGFCLVRIGTRCIRDKAQVDRVSLYWCVGVFALAILINDAPYRLIRDRDGERVVFRGDRCYIIGDNGDRLLLFCPEVMPPRNRIVTGQDPDLQRLGIKEVIYSLRLP